MSILSCKVCESSDHLTTKCHYLKEPKIMTHPCGYGVDGLGFYYVRHAPFILEKTDGETALIKVVRGGHTYCDSTSRTIGEIDPRKMELAGVAR